MDCAKDQKHQTESKTVPSCDKMMNVLTLGVIAPNPGGNKTQDQKYHEYIELVDRVDVISASLEQFTNTLNSVPYDQKRVVLYVNLLMFFDIFSTEMKMELKETARTVDRQFPSYEEKFARLRQSFVNLISFLNTPAVDRPIANNPGVNPGCAPCGSVHVPPCSVPNPAGANPIPAAGGSNRV